MKRLLLFILFPLLLFIILSFAAQRIISSSGTPSSTPRILRRTPERAPRSSVRHVSGVKIRAASRHRQEMQK
jgi:hypothetical protein